MSDTNGFREIAERLDAFLKPEEDERQARTRERILREATKLFVAYGYRKTSVEDVAGAARIAKGTVYLYYRNKAELFLHAITLQKQQYLTELSPAFDSARSPVDRLRTLIRLGIVLSQRMPLVNRSGAEDHEIEQVLADVDAETLAEINQQQITYLAGLIQEASKKPWPRDELEKRAEVLVDLMFAVANGGRLGREGMPLEEYAAILADVIVGGLVGSPG